MRVRIVVASFLGALCVGTVWGQPAVTILETTGRVELRQPGKAWRRASSGETVPLGATISTGFSSSAVLEAGSAVLDIEPLTRMRVDELIQEAGLERSELYLQVGRVRAEVQAVEGVQTEFRLNSPVSTAAVRGTSFTFDGFSLRVQQGRVQLMNRAGRWVTVGGGEGSSSDGLSEPSAPPDEAERAIVQSPYVAGAEERDAPFERPTPQASAGTGGILIEWELPPPQW